MRGAEPDDPARWLAAIARNECLTRIRERMRNPLPVADAGEAASMADPVADAARRADIGALWRAVDTLAPQQREALLLREFGGMSYEELALALGVTVPAVESLLFRARTRLRAELRAVASALAGFLPRLFAGGGVAKVASVTVTAGLLTGGVVAGEHVLRAGRVAPRHAAPAVRLVSPLSDLPPEHAPAPPAHRTATAPRRSTPAPSPPTVFAPSTPAPVLVSESRPSPGHDASSGDTSGQTETPDTPDAPVPVREADDASTPPPAAATEPQSGDTTTTPASADDGATTTTAAAATTTTTTTTPAQDSADTGTDGASGADGAASTDGGS